MTTVVWCTVCCTCHAPKDPCPGELLATGPERAGWRVSVFTPSGIEHYGVLVAPVGNRWRARVLTFPNMLWSAPGLRASMKFVGLTAAEAERKARTHVEEICRAREYKVVETADRPQRPRVHEEAAAEGAAPASEARHLYSAAVRFGIEAPNRRGATGDLSNGGMFLETKQPYPEGTRLVIVLDLEEAKIPLTGTVAWVRKDPADGRPAGMGIQLHSAPALYRHYVDKLARD